MARMNGPGRRPSYKMPSLEGQALEGGVANPDGLTLQWEEPLYDW